MRAVILSAVFLAILATVVVADRNADIVNIAKNAAAGHSLPGWGDIPYVWGGGHSGKPGPSKGTCAGYTGPQPCKANVMTGVDCSGFTRWVYNQAFGSDKLGAGTAANQLTKGVRTTNPVPGNLVFFGSPPHHVGIYIGNGRMINAPHTGAVVREDNIAGFGSHVFAHY